MLADSRVFSYIFVHFLIIISSYIFVYFPNCARRASDFGNWASGLENQASDFRAQTQGEQPSNLEVSSPSSDRVGRVGWGWGAGERVRSQPVGPDTNWTPRIQTSKKRPFGSAQIPTRAGQIPTRRVRSQPGLSKFQPDGPDPNPRSQPGRPRSQQGPRTVRIPTRTVQIPTWTVQAMLAYAILCYAILDYNIRWYNNKMIL